MALSARDAEHRPAVLGWMLFDWAQQPFATLILTFIFAPYFAAQVAATPAEGQALWGLGLGIAGGVVALLSPVLGAIADEGGRRKRWIAAFSVMLVLGSAALWLAEPGAHNRIPLILAAVALAEIGSEFAFVFINALMPRLVAPGRLGSLSGTASGLGYAGGLVALALTIGLLVAAPGSQATLAGLPPLLGAENFAGERATGPLTAMWFLVFAAPFFLFTPGDEPGLPLGAAVRTGLAKLVAGLRRVRERRVLFRFLIARMLYQDGLSALFAFGGIYAAGTFGWGATELGLFGILLSVAAMLGAWAGGRFDDRFGPKPVIAGALVLLLIGGALVLSVDRESVFFMTPLAPGGEGLFASPAERFYILFGLLIGLAAGPVQASSRTLLIRLAPAAELTQAFGFFALAGRATAFAAPLTVAALTWAFGSQRIGMGAILLFLGLGLALLVRVNAGSGARP